MNDFANAFKTCGFNFKIFDFVEKKRIENTHTGMLRKNFCAVDEKSRYQSYNRNVSPPNVNNRILGLVWKNT